MNKELTPLEALNNIKNLFIGSPINPAQQFEIIETALKKYKVLQEVHKDFVDKNIKKLKALEIIKTKPIVALVDYKYTYEEWLDLVEEKDKDLFENKEEYDLLKEVLK